MGKTKTKIIDDSLPEVEVKGKKLKVKSEKEDELVEKLKEELGIKEEDQPNKVSARGDSEEGSRQVAAASEASEDARRDTELARFAGASARRAGPRAPGKKIQKPGKAKPRSKKYQEISKGLDRSKTYPINEAVDMVKKLSYAKFNATLEAHINTAQTGIRGLISLPFAAGKKLRTLAFGKGADISGAEIFGDDSTIESISQGKVNFDLVITTPEWMPKLAKVAKILGPKGLMPNPKNGTITNDLKKAVESFQAGKTEYKTEPKAPVIHLPLGKLNQPSEELSANIKILLSTLGKTKIKKVKLSPTMGPSVKIDLTSI